MTTAVNARAARYDHPARDWRACIMWVKCDYSDCEHNRDQECQLNSISLVDGSCTDYKDYMKSNPLYQSPYFKRCRTQINGKAVDYRAQSKGMRYEWMGFVLYTEDDIFGR